MGVKIKSFLFYLAAKTGVKIKFFYFLSSINGSEHKKFFISRKKRGENKSFLFALSHLVHRT